MQPRITGDSTVDDGGILKLTCDAESQPPAKVTWTVVGSDTVLVTGLQTASLFIPEVTPEHSGNYSCTATHLNETKTAFITVTVTSKYSTLH